MSHFHGASRTLSSCYALLNDSLADGLPWHALWSFALAIVLGCCEVAWCSSSRDICIAYADACAAQGTVGLCNYNGSDGLTASIPSSFLSNYARNNDAQQTAELYGVALAVAVSAVRKSSSLIFTDSSACLGWFNGNRLPPTRLQSRLLLASSIMQTMSSVDCTVRWTPSETNPADPWSGYRLDRLDSNSLVSRT